MAENTIADRCRRDGDSGRNGEVESAQRTLGNGDGSIGQSRKGLVAGVDNV